MPGPVSDSYDPEWGTAANVSAINSCLRSVYEKVSHALGNSPPLFVLDLVRGNFPKEITATLTEKEWRLLRFALERAMDSL